MQPWRHQGTCAAPQARRTRCARRWCRARGTRRSARTCAAASWCALSRAASGASARRPPGPPRAWPRHRPASRARGTARALLLGVLVLAHPVLRCAELLYMPCASLRVKAWCARDIRRSRAPKRLAISSNERGCCLWRRACYRRRSNVLVKRRTSDDRGGAAKHSDDDAESPLAGPREAAAGGGPAGGVEVASEWAGADTQVLLEFCAGSSASILIQV